jgi:serine-type D-Ala-D-Ala carboxypeptidase/endopeptidase (penicillin-binding protein 4)
MTLEHPSRRRALQGLAASLCAAPAWPSVAATKPAAAPWPDAVEAVLQRAKIPRDAMGAIVTPVDTLLRSNGGGARLSINAQSAFNPASLEKLLTTQAALDLLGPAWTWATPVWFDGVWRGDTLQGQLIIKGVGDPKWVVERLMLLMQRVRQMGVRVIDGDIVLDQSAFDVPDVSPAAFDQKPLRAYNVRPQALLLAQKSVVHTITPVPERGVATVASQPPLQGANDITVPLSADACGDWQNQLSPGWDQPARHAGAANDASMPPAASDNSLVVTPTKPHFNGSFPTRCGEKSWALADAEPDTFHARTVAALWAQAGGSLTGTVRESRTPVAPASKPTFELVSPPLAEVVRDINKYSNNPMAKQLFLTLALQKHGVGTWVGAREVLTRWLLERVRVPLAGLVIDNGSGLSRDSRVTPWMLAQVLQHAWRSPTMPDLMASLPAAGVDGTLRRSTVVGAGRAHLKTGSLRDAAGVAGYVMGASGRRYVVAAMANHEPAHEAREAINALVHWVADDVA